MSATENTQPKPAAPTISLEVLRRLENEWQQMRQNNAAAQDARPMAKSA